jgi:chemotaxis protein MotB
VSGASVEVRSDDSIGIRVASGSLFNTGSAVLSDSGQDVLAVVGDTVNGYSDYNIRVEGHTDNVPIGPVLARKFSSNWELSVARAASAVRYLSESGVAADRLSATGYGEFRPIATNDSEEGREQNRRVEVVLYPR